MRYRPCKWPRATATAEPIYEIGDAPGFEPEVDYCGVAAMASITGLHCKFLTQTIQKMRGDARPVIATWNHEISNVLGYLGYRVDMFEMRPDPGKRETLNKFWHQRGESPAVIVMTRDHYMALDYALICDTETKGKAEVALGHPYMRSGVRCFMEVRKVK